MVGQRMLTARLTVNMIAADDVYTTGDQLLFPKGTVLTEEVIEALKEHSVFAIRIQVDDKDKNTPIMADAAGEVAVDGKKSGGDLQDGCIAPEPSYPEEGEMGGESYYDAVRQTQEFQKFNSIFLKTIDHMKELFNRVVMQNEEIDSDKAVKDVENVVSQSRNSLHILDMLQCMRRYDDETYVHSLNVALLSNVIGKLVFPSVSKEDLDSLTLSGLLPDIGKMLVPDEVLRKKDHLTISEFNVVKTHVLHGSNILAGMKGLDPRVAEVAMRHHERCDGSGYPGGWHREQITPFAKIVAIADTYDAMTSDRVYRKAICPFDVIHMFEREGLVKFEVEYLLPFLTTAVQAYMNAEVYLTTNEIGKVVMVNADELSKPIVKVGDTYYNLAKDHSISIDRMVD